jgi:hypothetical protein
MGKLHKLARKQTSYDSPQIVSPEKDIHLYVYLDDKKKIKCSSFEEHFIKERTSHLSKIYKIWITSFFLSSRYTYKCMSFSGDTICGES